MANRVLTLAAVLLTSAACAVPRTGIEVQLALKAVQRPQDAAERWGEYTLFPADSGGYTYQDGLVRLGVVPGDGVFAAVIENRSEHSIRLLWSEGSYVGPTGLSSGIAPGETRWIEMNRAPATQVIPSRARAAVVIIPRANADISEQTIRGFYASSALCGQVKGTSIRLLLPLEIQGVTNEYSLEFEPTQADVVTWMVNDLGGARTEKSRVPCDEMPPQPAPLNDSALPEGARFVASYSRKVVYAARASCNAIALIPETDRMYFSNIEDARIMGYTASTDPGCQAGP